MIKLVLIVWYTYKPIAVPGFISLIVNVLGGYYFLTNNDISLIIETTIINVRFRLLMIVIYFTTVRMVIDHQ
jgi:hypothetical protein